MKSGTMLMLGVLLTGSAAAQTVYESKDSKGRVFSDRPSPGSKAVELRPLNVIEPVPTAPAASKAAAEEARPGAAPAYRSLSVAFPEAGGSVAVNNATFEVRVSIDPPLQVGKGHAFMLRLDGRTVPGRYTANEMMVPPEFFGDVVPAGAQRHVLEVSVIDAQGASILTAAPVDFQTRFVNVLQRPHPLGTPARSPGSFPNPNLNTMPKPATKPAPKPAAPEPAPDSRPAVETRR